MPQLAPISNKTIFVYDVYNAYIYSFTIKTLISFIVLNNFKYLVNIYRVPIPTQWVVLLKYVICQFSRLGNPSLRFYLTRNLILNNLQGHIFKNQALIWFLSIKIDTHANKTYNIRSCRVILCLVKCEHGLWMIRTTRHLQEIKVHLVLDANVTLLFAVRHVNRITLSGLFNSHHPSTFYIYISRH